MINLHLYYGTFLLRENKIVSEYVPNDMTADFQVLSLTVNKWKKGIMIDKCKKWLAEALRKDLDSGKSLDEINIKFKLTNMKHLHAQWIIHVYNQLPSFEHKVVILAGWKASGISDNLTKSLAGIF